jgi:hypothetical protein
MQDLQPMLKLIGKAKHLGKRIMVTEYSGNDDSKYLAELFPARFHTIWLDNFNISRFMISIICDKPLLLLAVDCK